MDAASVWIVLAAVGVTLGSQSANAAPPSTPTRHTAYLAGQPGWESGSSVSPPTDNRYQLPADVVDRTRAAVVDTGNSLREGVEAGIQSANQQLYQSGDQALQSTRNASQEFTQQFQSWAGNTAQQAQNAVSNPFSTTASPQTMPPATAARSQPSNPFATAPPAASAPAVTSRNGVAPPPWAASAPAQEPDWQTGSTVQTTPRTAALGTVATQTASGWSSISSTLPPPQPKAPQLMNTPVAATTVSMTPLSSPPAPTSGPGFPAEVTANQPIDRSVLAQPQQNQPPASSAQTGENWDIRWGGNSPQQATIGGARYDNSVTAARQDLNQSRDFGAPPTSGQGAQPATIQGNDPWADKDPWGDERSRQTAATTPVVIQPAPTAAPAQTQPPAAAGTLTTNTLLNPPLGTQATPPATPEKPWVPLLVASLALAGSIGANLFLGWSYMDARQKYQGLVHKTASRFRRAAAAA